MQISSFNGGLNKRVSPYLLQSNEGVKYSNIDTTTGALAPLKDNKDLNAKIKPHFTYFNGHWVNSDEERDYVKFQGKIFYSNGVTRPQWSEDGFTWYGLGLDKPLDDSFSVSLLNGTALSIKPLFGYFSQGDNPRCETTPGFVEVTVCGLNTLLDFETDSFPTVNVIGSRKRVEIITNINSSIYEEGSEVTYAGKVAIKKLFTNTEESFSPVMIREVATHTSILGISGDFVDASSRIHRQGWYVRVDDSKEFIANDLVSYGTYYKQLASNKFESGAVCYVSSTPSQEQFKPTKNLIHMELEDIVSLVVFDKENNIKSVYQVELPQSFNPTKQPLAGGFVYFAGFSFEWIFEQTDRVEIYAKGFRVATRTHSDIVTSNRVYVNSEAIRQEETISLESTLLKISSVKYVITYESEFSESPPSNPQSVGGAINPDSNIFPVLNISASLDANVTKINVYRIGGSLTQYSLVKSFPNTDFTFIDNLLDSEIDGAVLNSYNNTPAPTGLEYLTLYNTILFGSIKDKLYYTNIANPFVWSQFNFIDFDDIITGIGGTSNGLLVFTRNSTYIITGTSPDTFSKYTLSSGVGCILHKSIQSLQNTLLWLSEDSICASNGGNIQTLSRDKLNIIELKTPRCSAVLNDVYYLSHNSGTLIADFRFGLTFRESNKVYYGLDVKDNTLYGAEVDDKFVEVNGGEKPLEIQYLSPKFSDGSISTMKIYKDIYFHSTGNLKAKVFIDDNLAGEQVLNKGFTEIKVNSVETRGYSIQFEVTGTGTLNEIEYKVEGRQNGR